MASCASCGRPLQPADRFCGHCGARVSAPAAPAPSPAPAPGAATGGALGWALLGGGLAITAATLALLLYLTTGGGTDASASDDGDGGDERVADAGRDAAPEGGTALRPLDPRAREVDRARDFPYVASAPSCAEHTRLTDELKQVAVQVDDAIRKGSELSWEEEQEIGEQGIRAFERTLGGRLTSSGALPDYVAGVGKPLLAGVTREEVRYRFYVWEDTEVMNAFALPGGHVVVSRPLFDRWLENEAQLAAVLGHEIGHVDLRHPLAVFETLRAMGVPEEDVVGQMLVSLARLPYSTAAEEAADRYGAERMHEQGYSVFQAVALWDERAKERPVEKEREDDDPLVQLAGAVLREVENLVVTHPEPARRACLLRKAAHDLYAEAPREVAYVGRSNLRERVPMARRVY